MGGRVYTLEPKKGTKEFDFWVILGHQFIPLQVWNIPKRTIFPFVNNLTANLCSIKLGFHNKSGQCLTEEEFEFRRTEQLASNFYIVEGKFG